MEQPKSIQFAVIMPVYNVEKYLEQSVQSVIAQTYGHFRLIMVDDGSTDNSGQICDDYAKKDSRVTVLHQPNQGQIAARTAGLKKARELASSDLETYILFLDSDDWLEPYAMETIKTHLSHLNCDCLIYGFRRILNGKTVSCTEPEENRGVVPLKEAYRKICTNSNYNSLCRKAIRLTAIPINDYSSYHHIRIGEDLLQTLDIIKQTNSIAFITDHLYNYRVNSNSVTELLDYEKYDFEHTVPLATLRFLREYDVHTKDTWILQWKHFSERLYWDIIRLLLSHHTWKEKRELLNKIQQSYYMQNELVPNIPYSAFSYKHRVILLCFKYRWYSLLQLCHLWTNHRNIKSKNARGN